MNIVSDSVGSPHIVALDPNGREIVGAFQPAGVLTWRLYFTNILSQEYHRCHPVVCTREDALQWVTVIAGLYDAAQVAVLAQRTNQAVQLIADIAGVNLAGSGWGSDFPDCDCPAYLAADLDDHHTTCTARRTK